MKEKKRISKKVFISIMIIILMILNVNYTNVSKAVEEELWLQVVADEPYQDVIQYTNYVVKNVYISYRMNGKEYPAYCLDKTLPGVGETAEKTYKVQPSYLVNDPRIWRVLMNGYPYKTFQELGCANKQEAYFATKEAIYCILYNNDENNFAYYKPLNEAGTRIINALKKIVNAARNGNETKPSSNLEIMEQDKNWTVDSKNSNYVSKIFSVENDYIKDTYKVEITGDLLEGIMVTNENNERQIEFNKTDKFKVLIPINQMKTDGEIKIIATAKVETFPIYNGIPERNGFQNYAILGINEEDGFGIKKLQYKANKTQITIIKRDNVTQKGLKDAEFRLLDENQKAILTDLKSSVEGSIILKNLIPGKYFLEETKAPEGYTKLENLVEINLEYNMQTSVYVNNTEEKKTEVVINKNEIEVTENKKEEIEITENIKQENVTTNTNIQKTETTNNTKKEENKVTIDTTETNTSKTTNVKNQTKKLPKTGM